MAPPRSLVTGGAGFLGSHLCERLLADGHEVICMDNLLTGNDENVSHLSSVRFHMTRYDVTHFLAVPGKLDYVYHFASPASPVDYLEFPTQTLKVGARGT
ncbi:MAG TPA: NAD-dependent epimerase/dehydratase family protein, partial [Nitrospinota bacterium]|nr:NAD-dependent epimerase/dehydratase family protein [Nitrospinota bacterium]